MRSRHRSTIHVGVEILPFRPLLWRNTRENLHTWSDHIRFCYESVRFLSGKDKTSSTTERGDLRFSTGHFFYCADGEGIIGIPRRTTVAVIFIANSYYG